MQKTNKNTEELLDEILRANPDVELPRDFPDRMAIKFEKYMVWKQNLREFLFFLAAGLGLLGITVAMLFFLMAETWQEWTVWIIHHQTGTIGIGILLVFILFVDKVLLRYFSFCIHQQKI
jgi:hypothetical protein